MKTLVICSSYSGNTEETISAMKKCHEREAKIFIKSGSVKVYGVIETRRGRKLNKGDKVMFLKNELIFE